MPPEERASTSDPDMSSDSPEQNQPQVDPDRPLEPPEDTEHVDPDRPLDPPGGPEIEQDRLHSRGLES
jgi:hypothetical protein